MIEIRKMMASLVAVVLMATSALQGCDATEYIVGKTSGWVVPHERNDFYNHWASEFKFNVGDVLVFNFVKGMHDVFEVTKEDYEACEAKKPIATIVDGPAKIKLHSSGYHYFICTFPGHCNDGQRLAVKVGGHSSTASSPAAAASSSSSPAAAATAPSPHKKASHSSHHGHTKAAETPKVEEAPSEAPTPESTKDSSGEAPSPSNTEAPSEAPTPEAQSEAPAKEHIGSHSHGTAGAPSEHKHKNLHGVKHDLLQSQDLQMTRPLLKL